MHVRFLQDHRQTGHKQGDVAECFMHQKAIRNWFLIVPRTGKGRIYHLPLGSLEDIFYTKGPVHDYEGGNFAMVSEDVVQIVQNLDTNQQAKKLLLSFSELEGV